MAGALHLLVSDQPVLPLHQRRPPRDVRDGHAQPRVHPDPIPPGRSRPAPPNPDLQTDLERALPHATGRRARTMSETTNPQPNSTPVDTAESEQSTRPAAEMLELDRPE